MTFHREGPLAHQSLRAMRRCVAVAEAGNLNVDVVLMLDRPDDVTRQVVSDFGWGRRIEVDHGDLALSRNDGMLAARGALAGICDGDDYVSANWLLAATETHRLHPLSVLVPEYVVNFGDESNFVRQVDAREEGFPPLGLLSLNPWAAFVFAERTLFLEVPYVPVSLREGYGFEDWHWHCQTTARGRRQTTVPQTAGFYRRRSSMLRAHSAANVTVRPSSLFGRQEA